MSADLSRNGAWALTYAGEPYSFAVFPVHSTDADGVCSCPAGAECGDDAGKHPRVRDNLNIASTDERVIRHWWRKWPDANVAVACGKSGLVVLDVDPRNGGLATFARLVAQYRAAGVDLLDCPKVWTPGGGLHLHFLAREGFRIGSKEGLAGPGVDVKAEGGYVLLPPSRIGGGSYVWA